MEIRHLKSFKTIVELDGFNLAAEHLGYAQSTITSHIQAIENRLGSPVFERIGNKNILTDTGKTFLPYATEMLNLYSLSIEDAQHSDTPKGTLVIGSTESLTIHKLLPIISAYNQKYPLVDITLKSGDGDKLREMLRSGEIDIALLFEHTAEEDENLHIQEISDETMVFIKSNHESVLGDTILFTQKGCAFRSIFENYLTQNHIPVKSILEFRSVESIKESIKNGCGISLLPTYAVETEIAQNKVTVLPWSTTHIKFKTLLSYHKNKWISSAMEAFINVVDQQL